MENVFKVYQCFEVLFKKEMYALLIENMVVHVTETQVFNVYNKIEIGMPLIEWASICQILGSGLVDATDSNNKAVVGIASWVYPVIL